MDRTFILGDTIDYRKELLGKINHLQLETEANPNSTKISKNVRPNEVLVRNIPKFDVERRNVDTRIDIYCAGKPGLLLLTLSNLEALGLEIEECVISCFNDFTMQASCSDQFISINEFLKPVQGGRYYSSGSRGSLIMREYCNTNFSKRLDDSTWCRYRSIQATV